MSGRQAGSGQAIVVIALMLTVLIGMVALAVDGSRAYGLRRDLQAAVDAAALGAGDKLQQTGSYVAAEQAATTLFGTNMRLYAAPSCNGYGTPGAAPWTVTCTYPDTTALTQVVRTLGPQGSQFAITATRQLQLQFARVLTNGTVPRLGATSTGGVNNLRYTPALAALDQAGCGGASGSALSLINLNSTLNVFGDVVSNGSVSSVVSSMRVTGDLYARCQASVPGASTACYPGGASPPCSYPDVAGVTRTGYRFADPGFRAPAVPGGSQAVGTDVVLRPGAYAANPNFTNGRCWFLAGGVYQWTAGYTNTTDFVSNELKPPDEPVVGNNTALATPQFWNTGGYDCAGSFQVTTSNDPRNPVRNGNWGVVLTSVRTDTYNGVGYTRESAPSMCRVVNTATRNDIVIQVSNVPGATSYNVYLSQPGNACGGPFGYVGNLAVAGSVSNNLTPPCPIYSGGGCSLGNEQLTIDQVYLGAWTPNALAAPDTLGAYPPDQETSPLGASLPNQNPARGAGATGDRANENACETAGGAFAGCPNAVTPGAVEFYLPPGSCWSSTTGDTYVFSGYQYDWIAVYEPPGNTCSNSLGAGTNSAYTGMIYAPDATISINSRNVFNGPGEGGLIVDDATFVGTPPQITYNPAYAPWPPASHVVG